MINYAYGYRKPATSIYHCFCCARSFRDESVVHATDGKAAGIMAGLIIGAASKNVLVGLGIALIGALAGHLIDQEVSPKCPLCGEVLKLLVNSALQT